MRLLLENEMKEREMGAGQTVKIPLENEYEISYDIVSSKVFIFQFTDVASPGKSGKEELGIPEIGVFDDQRLALGDR